MQAGWLWLTGLFLLVHSWTARAEGEDHEERIRDLERQNQELREAVEGLQQEDDSLEEEIEDYLDEGLGLNLVINRGNVHGIFQIFGDVGVRYDNPEVPGRSNTFFFSGSVDFFFTARVGDHFHMLSETVFVGVLSEPKDEGKFDQERLWGAWKFSDKLRIKLGLEHGPISRWNYLYHHGRWLEMTVNRPLLARFEGGGGILPMHNAGVEFTGALETSSGRFNWTVFVSNGRGRVITDTQEFSDRNDAKAVDLGLGFMPEGFQYLWIGVFFRVDKIAPNEADPDRQGSIREYIGTFQVDYRSEMFEILSEFGYIEDKDEQSDSSFGHLTGYFQLAYHLDEKWTPYARFDFREMDQGDPYYEAANRDLDAWELLFGIRFDFVANAALKLEVGFGDRETRDDGGIVSTGGYTRIGLQLSWVF